MSVAPASTTRSGGAGCSDRHRRSATGQSPRNRYSRPRPRPEAIRAGRRLDLDARRDSIAESVPSSSFPPGPARSRSFDVKDFLAKRLVTLRLDLFHKDDHSLVFAMRCTRKLEQSLE